MTPPVSYAVQGEMTSPKFARAFADGCGGRVSFSESLEPGEVAVFGSPKRWPLIQQAMTERRCFYADHGYFGRGAFLRIARNAYQHDGISPGDQRRFFRFDIPVQPWRSSGTHIVVCPNSPTYFGLFGMDAETWLTDVRTTLARYTDRPIVVRWKRSEKPLAADLVDAWAVVTYSSNAAVEAVLAGVPVFVLAPFAAASRMGLSDLSQIEHPIYPDGRWSFAASLASNQWTLEEIAGGVAWRALQESEAQDAA